MARALPRTKVVAEAVRFELTKGGTLAGFQDRCLKPLGHASATEFCRFYLCRERDSSARGDQASFSQRVLVDPAILHDDEQVFLRIFDQPDVGDRVAVDQQKVGERAFL